MPQIKVRIHKDGRVELDGLGFQGAACSEAFKQLLAKAGKALGDVDVQNKPEFYETSQAQQELGGQSQ